MLPRDAGNYTCRAVNRHGEATLTCSVSVKGKTGIVTEPQLPKSFRTGTDSISRLEENLWRRHDHSAAFEEPEARPPR